MMNKSLSLALPHNTPINRSVKNISPFQARKYRTADDLTIKH